MLQYKWPTSHKDSPHISVSTFTLKLFSGLAESHDIFVDFQMELPMGNQKGIMVSTCELQGNAQNILNCDSEEITKGMKFKAISVFTKAGFINTRFD